VRPGYGRCQAPADWRRCAAGLLRVKQDPQIACPKGFILSALRILKVATSSRSWD
jgi:hypothetical protein